MAAYAGLELGFAWGWGGDTSRNSSGHTLGARKLAILECLAHVKLSILPQLIVLPLLTEGGDYIPIL